MKKFSIFNFQFSISKGFTLIELLIVIAIIGILTALLTVNFIAIRQRARDAQRKSELKQIQLALEAYRADNSDTGNYPSTSGSNAYPSSCGVGQDLKIGSGGNAQIYMKDVPCDPKTNNPYTYSTTGATYTLIACLENTSDTQKDPSNQAPCDGSTNWSYSMRNP